MTSRSWICILVVCVSLAAVPVFAQATGRLTGRVLDPSGASVPAATVSLFLPDGKEPVLTATTTSEGIYSFMGVRPEFYNLVIEKEGFETYRVNGLKVDPGREFSQPAVTLKLGARAEQVETKANAQNVQVSNAEVAVTLSNDQVRGLPLIDREPISLLRTQAGVFNNGRTSTTINGQRVSYSNVTIDGINVQDNFLRDNALDFIPNRILLDQVSEFTITTSNASSAVGGGSAQVAFLTPSGTNRFHGSGYWYGVPNALAAKDWFANSSRLKGDQFNQNQLGGSFAGPIAKDKIFFFANYYGLRRHAKEAVNTITLTDTARRGIYSFVDSSGVQQRNLLQLGNVSVDPAIQSLLGLIPAPNNSLLGDGRNTSGYAYAVRSNRQLDNVTGKLDYVLSPRNVFAGTFAWNQESLDRPLQDITFSAIPPVYNDNAEKLASASWRWNPTPRLTNEMRGGANFAPLLFNTREKTPYQLAPDFGFLSLTTPISSFDPQGRYPDNYHYQDNASYVRGRHNLQFGFQTQWTRVEAYNFDGVRPLLFLGTGSGVELPMEPFLSANFDDYLAANDMLGLLSGNIVFAQQFYNVTSRTSGFAPGAARRRHYRYDNYGFYLQDNWKVASRLTLNLGVRYEFYTLPEDRDGLGVLPQKINNNPIVTLLGNPTIDFAGSSVGRPYFKRDMNNFAPNIGFAYDVSGNGRMAIRGGYGIYYVNDSAVRVLDFLTGTNLYLASGRAPVNQGTIGLTATDVPGKKLGSGPPALTPPTFKLPISQSDVSRFGALALPDPNLRTPYVQQWNIGIQRQVKGFVVDARYVGNHALKMLRIFDLNQVDIRGNGFLDDFLAAQNNGQLASAAGLGYDPRYNANVAGSKQLKVFPLLVRQGFFDAYGNPDSSVWSYLRSGQVGALAEYYQRNRLNGPVNFYPNPLAIGGAYLLSNFSQSNFNAFQFDVTRRMSAGLQFQANYTYSKVLSDSTNVSQTRLEPFLDNANTKIERARAPFDLTHSIKANWIYDLPFGRGHRLTGGKADRLVSGWSFSGIMLWQSGSPFSVYSSYATLNSADWSGQNTAVALAKKGQLDNLFSFRQTGNGPYFVSGSAVGANGTGVDLSFFNPQPGTLGSLQRRMFSGPWTFNMDLGIAKATKVTESQTIELRMDSTNVFNHPTWVVGDMNINSTQFGRINGTMFDARRVQFALIYRF